MLSSTSRGSPFGSRKLQQTHATLKGNASKTQGELCFRYSSPVSETIWIFFSSWTEKKLLNYFLYRRLNLYSRSLDEINQYETFLLKEYFIDHLTKHLRVHRYNCFIERWVDTFRRIQQIWYFSDRTFERSCLRSIRLIVSLDEKRNSSLGNKSLISHYYLKVEMARYEQSWYNPTFRKDDSPSILAFNDKLLVSRHENLTVK